MHANEVVSVSMLVGIDEIWWIECEELVKWDMIKCLEVNSFEYLLTNGKLMSPS